MSTDTEISVETLIDALPERLHQQDLVDTWTSLAQDLELTSSRGMEMLIAIPRDLTLREEGRADSAWGGAWEWNGVEAVTRTVVVSILLAATLAAVGAGSGLAPVVIPAVLPLLFDFKRVRLERTADHYLRIIGARREIAERVGTLDELYDSLPSATKAELSKRELLEFLGMAVDAGRASERSGTFEVLPTGETEFRIKIA